MEAGLLANWQSERSEHDADVRCARIRILHSAPDPAFAIAQFNFDRDPARMDAFSSVYDTYRDATLAEFRKRGGKLLIFHGTADPIF